MQRLLNPSAAIPPPEGRLNVKLNGQVLLALNAVIETVQVDLPDLPNGETNGKIVLSLIP